MAGVCIEILLTDEPFFSPGDRLAEDEGGVFVDDWTALA
jgi:hypothetical protein